MTEAGDQYTRRFLDSFEESSQQRASNARALIEEIERRRVEAREQGRNFTALTEDQLVEKLARARSPMIVFQSWSGSTTTPGSVDYTVGVNNPDPDVRFSLFVHVFVGPANIASDHNEALALVDTRFPRLVEPSFAGLSVDPGATSSLSFALTVPAGIDPSNYLGNSFLFTATWHDPAEYLDRGLFVFAVT
jgi:hypothetical protein